VAIIWLLCKFLFEKYAITAYSPIYLGFIAGMLMHLVCDMATKGGLPLFYPYNRKRFSISVMESGSKFEFIPLIFICVLCIGLTVLFVWKGWYLTVLY
jgi:inner membrane protein